MCANFSTEKDLLDKLNQSISDVGFWNWWTADLPNSFQIEFWGIQLYFPTEDKLLPPSSMIAIQFGSPKSVSFLSKTENNEINDESWFNLLQQDKIVPITCDPDYFTFTDNNLIIEILNNSKYINTIFGYSPAQKNFLDEKYRLAFLARDYGMIISSENIRLLSHNGPIEIETIPTLNSKWWDYWKKYWELRETNEALPKDYACEVTIPLKDYKCKK